VTNSAVTFTNKGGLLFPANSQALAYDADGNLSFEGVWTYQWDGESQLVATYHFVSTNTRYTFTTRDTDQTKAIAPLIATQTMR
jgi:hypothetical protein